MEKIKIKAKEKNAIIESLKAGLVPRIGLQHIQVGRANELKEMIKDFALIADGGAKTRFIIGEYGSGKTFFLTLAKLIAHEKNFVVVSADITTEKVLCSSDEKSQKLFSELINNMSTKTKPDGGALKLIIERWASKILQKNEVITEESIYKELMPLEKYVACYDFSKVLTTYIHAYQNGDDLKISQVLRWLRAEYTTKTDARKELDVRTIIDNNNFYDYLKLFAGFVRLAGYAGLIVSFDELAVLARLKSTVRNKNFERILTIINDSLQGATEYIGFIFSGTPEFLEDKYKGMYSYGALESRLADNPFSKDGRRDLTGSVIRLESLSQEELYMLFHNIRNVFAEYDESKYLVTDEDIKLFMQWLMNKLGAKSFLSPRESNKNFVGLLCQLENYPQTNISDYLSGIKLEEEKEPADDELVSLKLEK